MWPITILFLLSRGLSFTQIVTATTAKMLTALLGEIPTGYLGDRIGRRNSLLISTLLFAVGQGGMAFAHTFPEYVALHAITGFAGTFKSGSTSAWLYDTLEEHDASDEFTYVHGRGESIRHWVGTAGMLSSGFLYLLKPTYPFIATGLMCLAGGVVLLTLPQNAQYTDEKETEPFTVLDAMPIVRERFSKPPLRSFVLYISLFSVLTVVVNEYIQPIAVDVFESLLEGVTIAGQTLPEVVTLGFLYASFTVVSAVASDYASNVESRLGVRRAMLLVPVGTAVFVLLPAALPLLAIPMFFVVKGASSLLTPMSNAYMNDHIGSVGRATVLSSAAMVRSTLRIPFILASGVIADATTPVLAIAAVALVFLAGSALTYFVEPPVGAGSSDAVAGGD
jgi:MFS family permease